MAIKTLTDLFLHTLKDVLYTERKLLAALPKIQRKAVDSRLKMALALHRDETVAQVERLEAVFDSFGKQARGSKCDAVGSLLEDADTLMGMICDDEIMDAALILHVQAVKHHEIARYGTLVVWARELGHEKAAGLLAQTLTEEHGADKALSRLAAARLNMATAA